MGLRLAPGAAVAPLPKSAVSYPTIRVCCSLVRSSLLFRHTECLKLEGQTLAPSAPSRLRAESGLMAQAIRAWCPRPLVRAGAKGRVSQLKILPSLITMFLTGRGFLFLKKKSSPRLSQSPIRRSYFPGVVPTFCQNRCTPYQNGPKHVFFGISDLK